MAESPHYSQVRMMLAAVVLLLTLILAGCSGWSTSQMSTVTPPGTYRILVTITGTREQHHFPQLESDSHSPVTLSRKSQPLAYNHVLKTRNQEQRRDAVNRSEQILKTCGTPPEVAAIRWIICSWWRCRMNGRREVDAVSFKSNGVLGNDPKTLLPLPRALPLELRAPRATPRLNIEPHIQHPVLQFSRDDGALSLIWSTLGAGRRRLPNGKSLPPKLAGAGLRPASAARSASPAPPGAEN